MSLGWSVAAASANGNFWFRGVAMPLSPPPCYIKLHTGEPGINGTANAAVNTQRYLMTFAAPAQVGVELVFASSIDLEVNDAPASEDYTHCSGWTALSSGIFTRAGIIVGGSVLAGNDLIIPAGQLTIRFPIST